MTARILVVDDQPELAELLQVVLDGEGHLVTAVHSGEAALGALSAISGLDLRRTTPPIAEIIDVRVHRFGQSRSLSAIQVHETVDAASLAEVKSRFDWSTARVYGLNAPGENHGVLLGTRGWTP